jgi:glutathione S-transferase
MKYYLAQIVAQYSNKYLIIKPIDNNKMSFGDIKLETENITLYDSAAISFFLSNSELRREDNLFASSQVLQWISYAQNHILPAVNNSLLMLNDCWDNVTSNISKKEVFYLLEKLDNILLSKTYLIGERISLADIFLFISLLPLYQHVLHLHYRQQYINLTRWFLTIFYQPQIKDVIKDFKFQC